jgi:small-conductance mechanosensitive channel
VSNLLAEVLLRLAKALAAGVVGLVVFAVLVGPLGVPPTAELALLAWLSGAAFVLLVESSPI